MRSAKLLLLAAASTGALSAATYTWQTAGSSDAWNGTDTNWYVDAGTTLSPWADGNAAAFGGSGGAGETITIGSSVSATGLTFNGTGFTITGGTVNLTGAASVAVTNAGDSATVNSVVGGSAGLAYAGAGTLTLGGTNTYTGTTAITGGVVKLSNASALGTTGAGNGTTVSGGGTLDINGIALNTAETITIAGTGVGGNGALINTGASQLNALNNLTLSADATVGGTQRFDIRSGTTPTLNLAGFTLTKAGANQFSLVGTTVSNGNLTVNGGTLSVETTSVLQGTGTVTINSGGTLAFYSTTGANITRDIVSNGGAISNTGSTSGVNSAISLASGTTTFGSANGTGVTTTFNGVISGSGAFVKSGTDIVTLTANNTFTGGTTVTGGILVAGAGNSGSGTLGGGNVTVNSGGTIQFSGDNAFVGYTTSSLKTITINAGGLIANTGSGTNHLNALVMNGGTLSAASANTTYGNWNFDQGISTGGLGTSSFITGGNATLSQTGGTNINVQGADKLTVSAALAQIGTVTALQKNGTGTLVLSGANTYTTATQVNAGRLVLAGSGTLATSAITVASGAALQIDATGKTLSALTLANGSTLAIAAQTGGQTTTVTGALTFASGATSININPLAAGTMNVNDVINLVTAGSIVNAPSSGVFTTTVPGSRVSGTTAVVGNTLQFTVLSTAANLVWNNAAANGQWDTTSNNFLNGSSNDKFYAFDSVTFNDTASTKTVTLVGTIQPGSVTVNNSSGDYTFAGSGAISGGTFTKSGTSNLNMGGLTASGLGSFTINGGTVSNGTVSTSAFTLNGGTFSNGTVSTSAFTLNGGTFSGTMTAATTTLNAGTVSGTLAGAGAVTKATSGTVTLSGTNSYSGGTTVSGGTLVVASTGALGSGALTINAGAAANYDISEIGNRTINNAGSLNFKLGGTTYAADSAAINFTANNASIGTYGTGANAVIRDFDVNSVALNVAAGVTGATVASTVNLNTNSYGFRIDVAAGGSLTVGGVILGNGSAGAAAAAGAMVGTDSTALYKRGEGNLTLTGASTFGANTNVAVTSVEGTLTLSGGNDRLPTGSAVYLGSTNNIAGTLALAGVNQTITGLNTIGTATTSAVVGASATLSTLTINNTNNYTFGGKLGGTGTNQNNLAIVKSGTGTLTLTGLNTYTGNTTITAGTVSVTAAGQLLMKIASGNVSNSINVASGATLLMDGALALDLTGVTGAGSWNLITGAGTKSMTSGFTVKTSGGTLFNKSGNLWTYDVWSYDQGTGILTAVPEPSTYGLLGAGAVAGVAFVRRRKRARVA